MKSEISKLNNKALNFLLLMKSEISYIGKPYSETMAAALLFLALRSLVYFSFHKICGFGI